MDYEKKYKEALERARKLYYSEETSAEVMIAYENIFPELTESEDERIRQALIEMIYETPSIECEEDYNLSKEDILAWLEKQGEQMTTDKVEPKFKVGDYVVGKYISGYITEVRDDCYLLDNQGFPIDKQNNYHLWTIQDAKDGDVLASELCYSIILFRGIKDNNIDFYCDYDFSEIDIPGDRFAINNGQHYGNLQDSKDFHPATKEQCNLFFQKMKEAGYEFAFDKKELKKIK